MRTVRACWLRLDRWRLCQSTYIDRVGGVRKPTAKRAAQDLGHLLRTKWNPLMSTQECIRWLNMTKA